MIEPHIGDASSLQDEAFLKSQLHVFNVEATGVGDGRDLVGFVREADGRIIGGISGWTWGGACSIDTLWVRADRRGEGIGRSLLRAAEAEARRRGAENVSLDTYSFQAPDFYYAEGYAIVAERAGSPFSGHRQLFLRKEL